MPVSGPKLLCLLALLGACGSQAGNKGESTPPDAGPPVPCTVEDAIRTRLAEAQGAVDCGVLMPPNTTEHSAAGQKCVLDAIEAGQAFRFVHYLDEGERKTAEGFVRDADGVFTIFSYDSDPGGKGQGARVTVHRCKTFGPYADCDPTPGFACLECVDAGETTLWCREPT